VVLSHHILEILHLADHDGGAVLCVVAFDGGFSGVTAVNGKRRRDAMPADGLLQKL
jgi:hypothetical protein